MPEDTTTITESPTAAALDLKAKTDAALNKVTGGGFNTPEFDASLQAAIDKDLGKAPAATTPPPATPEKTAAENSTTLPPAKPAADKATKANTGDEIPGALLGEKPPATEKTSATTPATEEERQKFLDEQTKGMSPKASARFADQEKRVWAAEDAARKVSEERVAEQTTLKKQLEEATAKATNIDQTEVTKLKAQVEELDALVSKVALQDHPRFKAKYDGQISTEIEKLKKSVVPEHADELANLFALPESKKRNERIAEIAETMEDIPKTKVLASLERVDRWASEKSDELSKWKENKIHLEADVIRSQEINSAKMQEIQQVAWSKGMGAVSAPRTGLEVFQKADGHDAWNAKVDERVASVKKILSEKNVPPEKLVELAAKAVAVDDYRQMFMNERTKRKQLETELEALKVAEPNAGEGGGGSGTVEDKDDFITAAVKGAVKAGALRE